jgi:N-acetylneuraminate synthase
MTTKIIAEIGINHRGSLDIARSLIDQAAESSCWGVKFQYRHLKSFYHTSEEIGDGIILEELERIDFSLGEYITLADYARNKGLNVGVSFFRIRDIVEFGSAADYFDFFKVPSAECTNTPLIRKLISTGKQVMVSTGGHTNEQIEKALVPFIEDEIVIFHCVANYPAKFGSQNLNVIKALVDFGFKEVGYSSHDEEIEVCLLAMSLGATWIERHLTQNVNGPGLDDSSSSEVDDFFKLEKYASEISNVLGSTQKVLNQGEILNMQNLGTGMYANRDLVAGSIVKLADFEIKAPRVGLSVGDFLTNFQCEEIKLNMVEGKPLEYRSFREKFEYSKEKLFKFAKTNNVGIPVRLHDFGSFKEKIQSSVYEFHLSYQESIGGDFKTSLNLIDKADQISIHLPDYLPGNRIIDPVSEDFANRDESRKLISNITDFAESIRQKTGRDIPIVGSFSQTSNKTKEDVLDELFGFLDSSGVREFNILPQWLPVYAWYFGGAVKLELFNSVKDIKYIVKNERPICLDLCHLALSANYANADWQDWYAMLEPYSRHLHLADAVGVDGEGLPLGEGDIGDFSVFLKSDEMKIIEVWQGHFNEGEGFLRALNTLANT